MYSLLSALLNNLPRFPSLFPSPHPSIHPSLISNQSVRPFFSHPFLPSIHDPWIASFIRLQEFASVSCITIPHGYSHMVRTARMTATWLVVYIASSHGDPWLEEFGDELDFHDPLRYFISKQWEKAGDKGPE